MRWSTKTLLALALLAGCSSTAERAEPEPAVAVVAQPIQGGELDTTHTFAVGVCNGSRPGHCDGICSGALILPNVVATARHCVSESDERIDCTTSPVFGADKTGFYVTTKASMLNGSTLTGWYNVKSVARPTDNHVCGHDIAILILDSMVPATEATPITPGVQHLMGDTTLYDPSFTAIGYGRTSPATSTDTSPGGLGGAGTRRIRDAIPVTCIPGSSRPCPSSINPNEFIAGDGTCSGDSGSSAYETSSFKAGNPISFGVLSRGGQSSDGSTCVGSLYTRFDAQHDFVLGVVAEASENWALYPQPDWTIGAPPAILVAETDAGASTTLGNAVIGEACTASTDCSSGVCVDGPDADGAKVCSRKCDASLKCSTGYACTGGVCLKAATSAEAGVPSTVAAAPGSSTATATCSFAPPPARNPAFLAGAALAALGIVVRRRRNRA